MSTGRVVVTCFAAALVLLAASKDVRTQAPAATLVSGQVVDAVSNRPVGDMVVTLSVSGGGGPPGGAAQRKVLTDGSGRFAFQGLPAGRYSITATRAGFVPGALGKLAPRGGGAPLTLADGERVVDLRILVWKHASLRGRVTDEANDPIVGARVTVLRRTMISGRPGFSDAVTATTDDRGDYHAGALEPGAYVTAVLATSVSMPQTTVETFGVLNGEIRSEPYGRLIAAAPELITYGSAGFQSVGDHLLRVHSQFAAPLDLDRDGAMRVYPTAFHGGAAQIAEAEVVNLVAGERRAGIDVTLRLSRVFRLSGTIATSREPARPTPMVLWPAGPSNASPGRPVAATVSDASGRFTFLGVPPGQYLLRAIDDPPSRGAPATASTFWVSEPVTVVDRDVSSLGLTMQAGFRVAGRIVIEGDAASLPLNRLFLNLDPVDRTLFGDFIESQVAPDGTFRSIEAPAARYRLTLPLPSGWFVKSITRNGQALEDLPFELKESLTDLVITVSNRGAQLKGSVRTAAGAPDATAAVVLFPADSRQWVDFSAYARGIKDVRTGRDGAFALADLPEGDYLIVAIAQQQLDWAQPRFFETLSRLATRVTLGAAEARTLDLRTVTVKW